MKITIRFKAGRDDEVAEAIRNLPAGRREAELRRALGWYLSPGGFRELLTEIRQIGQLPRPTSTQPEPSLPQPPKDIAAVMDDAISQLFGDEENED